MRTMLNWSRSLEEVNEVKKQMVIFVIILMMALSGLALAQEKILDQFEKARCLQVIYVEEKTWWKLYDRMSGKLLGEVSSWGWKVYP